MCWHFIFLSTKKRREWEKNNKKKKESNIQARTVENGEKLKINQKDNIFVSLKRSWVKEYSGIQLKTKGWGIKEKEHYRSISYFRLILMIWMCFGWFRTG